MWAVATFLVQYSSKLPWGTVGCQRPRCNSRVGLSRPWPQWPLRLAVAVCVCGWAGGFSKHPCQPVRVCVISEFSLSQARPVNSEPGWEMIPGKEAHIPLLTWVI